MKGDKKELDYVFAGDQGKRMGRVFMQMEKLEGRATVEPEKKEDDAEEAGAGGAPTERKSLSEMYY